MPCRLTDSEILDNLNSKLNLLEPEQRQQLKELLLKDKDVFSDVPRRTNAVDHDVYVDDARPVSSILVGSVLRKV